MLGSDATSYNQMDSHSIINQITNSSPLRRDYCKDICSQLSNSQLKKAYLDCYQNGLVIQDNDSKELYDSRCELLIDIMEERIKENGASFKVFISDAPILASHLVQRFLNNAQYVAKIIDQSTVYDWHSPHFVSEVEKALLRFSKDNQLGPHSLLKYCRFCQTLGTNQWNNWLNRVISSLPPDRFFHLLHELDTTQLSSILFLNQYELDDDSHWQSFFDQLSDVQLTQLLYEFLVTALKKNKNDIIRRCYAKAVVQINYSDDELKNLFEKLLEPTLPASSILWVESIITELNLQKKLNNGLVIWLIKALANPSKPSDEGSETRHKAILLLANQFKGDPKARWPECDGDDKEIAYQIMADLESMMVIVGKPSSYSYLPSFSSSTNQHLTRLLDKIDAEADFDKLFDQWLSHGHNNWKNLTHIIDSIYYLNSKKGNHLLLALTRKLGLGNYKYLSKDLARQDIQQSIFQNYLTPVLLAKKLTSGYLSKTLPLNTAYWTKHLAAIVDEMNITDLPKLIAYLPPSQYIFDAFWQLPKVKENAAWLFMQTLKVDDTKTKICLGYWLRKDHHSLSELIKGILPLLRKEVMPISSLVHMSALIKQYAKTNENVNELTQSWLQGFVLTITKSADIMPHQWFEMEEAITTLLVSLVAKGKLSTDITISESFSSLFLTQSIRTKSASIAVNLIRQNPSFQIKDIIQKNSIFSQSISKCIVDSSEMELSIQNRKGLFKFLSPSQQHEFAQRQLSDINWVVEHFEFSLFLTTFVDSNFIYQQLKKATDPRPYIDLLIQKPYSEGLDQLNPSQAEQVYYNIHDQAHLVRLLKSNASNDDKRHLISHLLKFHIKSGTLEQFISRIQPDLNTWLMLLNGSNLQELGDLINQNPTWSHMLQLWLTNPEPAITIQADSQLYQLVMDSFCHGRMQYVPNLTLTKQLKPADALLAHQTLWQWHRYAQRLHDIFVPSDKIDAPIILKLLNGKWIYQLNWMNHLILPILNVYRQQSNPDIRQVIEETTLYELIIQPLLEVGTPSTNAVKDLYLHSQTQLKQLVEDYLSKVRNHLPEHTAQLETELKNISDQRQQESAIIPLALRQVVHDMSTIDLNPSGRITIAASGHEEAIFSAISEISFSFLTERSWLATWLETMQQQIESLSSEPNFTPWVCQSLLPSFNTCKRDPKNIIGNLSVDALFQYYENAANDLRYLSQQIPNWRTVKSEKNLKKLILNLYRFDSSTLAKWALFATQNQCILLADLLELLAQAKQSGLASGQVERLLPVDQISTDCQQFWWQQEWQMLIDNAYSTQTYAYHQFEQALLRYDDIESIHQISKLLSQSKLSHIDTWAALFNQHQHNQTILDRLVNQAPKNVLHSLISHPKVPYEAYMATLIAYLQTNETPFDYQNLLISWRENHWPIQACIEGILNSNHPSLSSNLALYCLTLSDHSLLEGATTRDALVNQTESHVLAPFSQAIHPDLILDPQWKDVSSVGALAILMDPHQFLSISDSTFKVLTHKTETENWIIFNRFLTTQLDKAFANIRLKQWYQAYPKMTLSCIEGLPSQQQTIIWLHLLDAMSTANPPGPLMEKLPTNDVQLYIGICERAFHHEEMDHALLNWLREQGSAKLANYVLDHPELVHVAIELSFDHRFNPQVIDLHSLAKTILQRDSETGKNHDLFFTALLNSSQYMDGNFISMLASHNADAVLSHLGKTIQEPVKLSNLINDTLSHLHDTADIRAKFELAYKHASLERDIQTMTGPFQWLRAWIKRLWHQLWVGNSPYISPSHKQDLKTHHEANQTDASTFDRLSPPFNANTVKELSLGKKPEDIAWPNIKSKTNIEAKIPAQTRPKDDSASKASQHTSSSYFSPLTSFFPFGGYANSDISSKPAPNSGPNV